MFVWDGLFAFREKYCANLSNRTPFQPSHSVKGTVVSPYRKIETRTYGDIRFRNLSKPHPCGQYLWLWLLTGPGTCIIPGVIRMGPAGMAELLGWSQQAFQKVFEEISGQGMAKADFSAPLVFIPKAIKHNAPQSPNVIIGWKGAWAEIPECPLKLEVWSVLNTFTGKMSPAFTEAFEKACPHPSVNQEQEQEQVQEQKQNSRGTADNVSNSQLSIGLPLKNEQEFKVEEQHIEEWQNLFPSIDTLAELRKMRAWLLANPKRRKTRTGIMRFCFSWLSKRQDNLGKKSITASKTNVNNGFHHSGDDTRYTKEADYVFVNE
jgi:hypothetical protein